MLNKKILILILTVFSVNLAVAQESKVNFSATAGITWRSPAMAIFNFNGVHRSDFQSPYVDERNIQGFGLNLGIRAKYKKVGFEYYPSFRYDVISNNWETPNIYDDYIKEFIVDHNFSFFVKRKLTYGLGATIVNTGKNIDGIVNGVPKTLNIQFFTINGSVAVPVKSIMDLEFRVHYLPVGYSSYDSANTLLYTVRAYREFDSIFRKKKS
uniref:hypothetical protein n=1 Tax=Fulvivirga sp. TaxID=1931237 RepID=UPI004049DF97